MYEMDVLAEWGRSLATADARQGSDGELCAAAVGLAGLGSRVQLAQARVVAELERRGVCDRDFGMSTGGWLAREAKLPPAACHAQVSTATALTRFPVVTEAVGAGTVSFAHAQVIARVANPRVRDAVAEIQDDLIALAAGTGFGRWKAEVAGIVELLDSEGGHDPADDGARNRLTVAESLDGVVHLHGEAVGADALTLAQLIDTKADELFRRYHADRTVTPDLVVPKRATLRMLALVELVRHGTAVPVGSSTPPRAEAMVVIPSDEPAATYDPTGRRLPSETTATLLCDADFYAVVTDTLGVPLDMGRRVRLATSHQRRALAALYGGCAFPGCDRPPRWCDAHHSDDWHTRKGHTNFSRLVPLCRRHHGITHRRGWHLRIDPDGWVWWQTPTGHTFWSQRHQRRRDHPPPHPIHDPEKKKNAKRTATRQQTPEQHRKAA